YYSSSPNRLLSLHPDYVMTHVIWPQEVGRCDVVCEFLFDADEVRRPGFDPSDAADFWDLTNRQDWHACELAYQGTESVGYNRGRLSTLEWMVHIFDNFVADRLLGTKEWTPITRSGRKPRRAPPAHIMLSWSFAASDIFSGVQGGSHTTSTLT